MNQWQEYLCQNRFRIQSYQCIGKDSHPPHTFFTGELKINYLFFWSVFDNKTRTIAKEGKVKEE